MGRTPRDIPHGRVLLVEDDADTRETLGLVLDGRFEIVVARNGVEALSLAETQSFDAILLDIMLPVMSGSAFMRALDPRKERPPVILISGRDDLPSMATKLGAAGYLRKPFSLGDLEAKLEALIAESFPDEAPTDQEVRH